MKIDAAGFEAMFRETIDPWNYAASAFEAYKRGVLLRACGARIYGRGLELACAIGETTRPLAPRCLRLLAVDGSPTALREAKRRVQGLGNVTLRLALLPKDLPRGPFDLIVASEIAYYLSQRDLRDLAERLERALAPGGRIVVLHHVRPFGDAAQLPALAQARMRKAFARSMPAVFDERHARFDVAAFEKPRGQLPRGRRR